MVWSSQGRCHLAGKGTEWSYAIYVHWQLYFINEKKQQQQQIFRQVIEILKC